jgi:hypothetical protein
MSTRPPSKRMRTWPGFAAITLVGILTLLVLPYVLSTYYLGLVIWMMIFALFAMSLNRAARIETRLERVVCASSRTASSCTDCDAVRSFGAAHAR